MYLKFCTIFLILLLCILPISANLFVEDLSRLIVFQTLLETYFHQNHSDLFFNSFDFLTLNPLLTTRIFTFDGILFFK